MMSIVAFLGIVGTIVLYEMMKKVYIKFYTPFVLPIVTTTIAIICLLHLFHISYETYMVGGKWIAHLLGPAVVAFAYPLYKQMDMVKQYAIPIAIGVFIGTVIGIVSGIELALLFHIEKLTIYSLVPKSVTTPVAMDIATLIGGNATLAAMFVMVAGITGAVIGPYLLQWIRVNHEIGKGIGFGTAAHGIGTAKALESGVKEGAISSVAMTLSTIFASLLSPFFVYLLL